MNLNQFYKWQQEKKSRMVEIKIGETPRTHDIRIFVYDYDLKAGQQVKSVEEIDLEGHKAEEERAEFERLKKKYKGE